MQKLACALTLVFLSQTTSVAAEELTLSYVQKRFDAFAVRGIVKPSYPNVDKYIVLPITKSLGLELDEIAGPRPTRSVVYFDAPPAFAKRRIWR